MYNASSMVSSRKIPKLALPLLVVLVHIVSSQPQPNIVVIVADDLGWNDVSFHGSPQIPTPNLDLLAREGIVLNDYYVCSLCTPSRGSLMTGLYPIHTGLQHDVLYGTEPRGLPLNINTLPQHLKTLNYVTHAVGKWHLGFFRKEYTPTYRGFDSHFGYWNGKEDYYDHTQQLGKNWGLDFHHNLTSVHNCLGNYSTSLFSNHAVDIVNNHDTSKPLFLYMAYQAVHSANVYSPLQAPQEFVDRFINIEDKNRKIFAGMVSALDDGVGTILEALHARSMLKNSIIIFTTDNGGPAAGFNDNAASNWPLRGVKATLWEGGVRGAAFIWSPLLNSKSGVSTSLMHITDWLPTLYRAAGGNVSSLGDIDGYDMWDTLSKSKPSPRTEVLLNIDPIDQNAAIRIGNYKLIQGLQFDGQWDGWYGPSGQENSTMTNLPYDINCGPKPQYSSNCIPETKPCLFDVTNDPCEYYNLADTEPKILLQLQQRLQYYNSTAVPPGNKASDPRSFPKYNNYEWINWMDLI